MWVTGIASAVLEAVLIPTLPEPLAVYAVQDATREITSGMWVSILAGSAALILMLWGSVELWRLKDRGRPVFLFGVVGTIVATPFYGPVIFTSAGMLLFCVSELLAGVILGGVYFGFGSSARNARPATPPMTSDSAG
jgi:predicted Abi (CAAX) family protease